MRPRLTRRDKLLLWTTVPLMAVVFLAHVHETHRSGLAQLPVFAEWHPGDYPQVGGYRLETDSSGSGLLPGDRLVRVGDRDLRGVGYTGFHAVGLARTTPGNPVPLVFERDGERRTIPLEARPHPQPWSRVPVLLVIPLVCVLLLLHAPGQPDVQRFYLCFMTYAIGQAQFYGGPEWKSWLAAGVWNAASTLMLFFMLRFTRLFPREMDETDRVPAAVPWLATGLFFVFVRANYVLAWPLPIAWVPRVSFGAHALMTVVGVAVLCWNYLHARPAGRRRLRWILLATALGSVPVMVAGLAPLLVPAWEGFRQAFAVGFLSSVIWMMGAVLGTVRDNAFDVDRLIGATAAWSLAAGGAVAGLAVAVPVVSAGLSQALGIDATTARLALAAVLGALVVPIGARLRPHVDRFLFPARVALQEEAAALVEELAHCESPDELLGRAARRSAELFDSRRVALYTRQGDSLVLARDPATAAPASLVDADDLPTRVRPHQVPPSLTPHFDMAVPIRPGGRIEALVALGPKRSGDIFTYDDAAVLGGVAARVESEWLHFQKRAADRESRAKTNLLATASHDLRQPLHAMSLLTEALRDKVADPEVRTLIAGIGDSTHDLDAMLTSLLDRSKLDAGAVRPDVEDVALADVFQQLERDFRGPADERGIRLRIVPSRLAVRSDRLMLARILRNLVSNALRYAGDGASVLLAARRRGDRVAIEVRDSGPGIPEARQRDVFEAFRQLDGADRGGLGLGLSIVDGLSRVLGHELELRSAPGRGATFRVLCATARPDVRRTSPPPATAASSSPASGGRRVLVVDDDPRVRAASLALLRSWGCETREAGGLREARAQLADAWEPELLLVDYELADGEDGLEVARGLRETLGRELYTAVATADRSPETVERIRAAGHPLLGKPVKPARLRAWLRGAGAE
ncbi:MAG: ATP-binding protein [Myxococcota bacterium]